MASAVEIRKQIRAYNREIKRLKEELNLIRGLRPLGGGQRQIQRQRPPETLTLQARIMELRMRVRDLSEQLARKRLKNINVEKITRSSVIRNNIVNYSKVKKLRKTSFYYMFRRSYFFNPYEVGSDVKDTYRRMIRTSFLGRFLSSRSSILNLEEKYPIIKNIKNEVFNKNFLKNPGQSLVSGAISKRINSHLKELEERWFPGKYGDTLRLIKAWITRKRLYGESGFSKYRQLSYGGYRRAYGLGISRTIGSTSYLSQRRSLNKVRRGFRRGGGYRRFA